MHYPIFNGYVSKVSDAYSLLPSELFTKDKRRDIVDARQLLYYLCHKRPMRIRYIQQFMEDNGYKISHSSIIHGIKQVKDRAKKDSDYKTIISIIGECVTL